MVKKVEKLASRINRQNQKVSAGFAVCCAALVSGITLCIHRGLNILSVYWGFSVGADIFCMAVCTALCFSCLLNRKAKSEHTQTFVSLLTTNAIALFLDECSWLVQGAALYRPINIAVNILFYMNGAVLVYMFWRYLTNVFNMKSRLMRIVDRTLGILLIPALLMCAVNIFHPLYFSVSADGVYQRSELWLLSYIYVAVVLAAVITGFVLSKAAVMDKLIMGSFVTIPLINQIITYNAFGISTQYAAMTISIVLIYGVTFARREQSMLSTEKELNLATRIQSDMLPNTFPFMPEREEFDVYASMDPAKNVGGDFYDFFLIDKDRLGLVIADVSGKGIPAALFMMAAKILIKNCAMTGQSPAQVLEAVNDQICQNNREEMFVTVWFGILDLTNGTLTAANAGHEYPIVKTSGNNFELYKDRHGFVIGGMEGMKYREYELKLEPGDKVFVYTDGATEAENIKSEQFGYDRLLGALNHAPDAEPMELISNAKEAVESFVDTAPQFDDLTFLCVEYKGGKKDEGTDA